MTDNPMAGIRLYNELAYLWPVISPAEDYAVEALYWLRAIRSKLGPGRHSLLELGVGGGHLLSHLTPRHQAAAVDVIAAYAGVVAPTEPGSGTPLGRHEDGPAGPAF